MMRLRVAFAISTKTLFCCHSDYIYRFTLISLNFNSSLMHKSRSPRQFRKSDVMHFLHVRFQILFLSISFAAKFTLELVGGAFSIDTVNPLNVLIQPELGSVALAALVAIELALVFGLFCLWVVFLVVGVQVFNVVVVALADRTDEVSRCHLQIDQDLNFSSRK